MKQDQGASTTKDEPRSSREESGSSVSPEHERDGEGHFAHLAVSARSTGSKGPTSAERLNQRLAGVQQTAFSTGAGSWIPYVMSGVLYVSVFFCFLAPFPLMGLFFHQGRSRAWLATITNVLFVFGFKSWVHSDLLVGATSAGFYFLVFGLIGLLLPEWMERSRSVEKSVLLTVLGLVAGIAGVVAAVSVVEHQNVFVMISQQMNLVFDEFLASVPAQNSLSVAAELEEWKTTSKIIFPSFVVISFLALVTANALLLLRVNPKGKLLEHMNLNPEFIKLWKAPEWLVWPTIVSGVFVVYDAGLVTDVAVNLFRFLMAIYAIQGLSILSFFFDFLGLRGILRVAGFTLAIFLMFPLVLSMGFFDLWFDFRSKFRHS